MDTKVLPRPRFRPPLLPIREWLPHYERSWLRADLMAAVAVWAVLVPEGMAYASLAGMPPETGLFAALAPLVVYAVLGTCRQLTVGPSSAIAAYSAAAIAPLAAGDSERFIALSALLALLAGAMLLAAGLARAGFVADFFARPVLTGFVAGLALVISIGQVPKLLGVEGGGTTFFGKLEVVLRELGAANLVTLAIGAVALALIFALRRFAPKAPSALIAVGLGTLAVYGLDLVNHGVAIVGDIPAGLPHLSFPRFQLSDITSLAPDAAALAVIMFAESVAGARAFAAKHGYEVDANQELIALGVSNLGAGILQGFSGDASLSRSAVADSSGARSQLVNLVLFAFLIVTMLLLMPLFHYLPEAVLGAIVIGAVAHLVNVPALRRLQQRDATDFLLALVSLAGVLAFGILRGLFIAVIVSLLALVFRAYRPVATVLGRMPGTDGDESVRYHGINHHPGCQTFPGLLIVRVDGELFFANARWFQKEVRQLVKEQDQPVQEVLIQAGAIPHIDTTAAEMLGELVAELKRDGIELHVARVTTGLRHDFDRNGISGLLGEGHFHDSVAAGVAEFLAGSPGTVSAQAADEAEKTEVAEPAADAQGPTSVPPRSCRAPSAGGEDTAPAGQQPGGGAL